MIVSEEMEEPVEDQVGDLHVVGAPRRARLLSRPRERDIDLAEEDLALGVFQIRGVGEGKGEDVGGTVRFQIIAVQRPQHLVAGQDEGDRGAGAAEELQRRTEERLKSGRS